MRCRSGTETPRDFWVGHSQADSLAQGAASIGSEEAWLTGPIQGSIKTQQANQQARLYWRPGCVFCLRLRFVLWLHHLSVRRINIWADPDAAGYVRSVANGNETVPTVVIDGQPFVNPSPRQVVADLRSPYGVDRQTATPVPQADP